MSKLSLQPKPFVKKSTVKKQFLSSLQKYCRQLEEELQKIYNNPDEIVGKLATAYQGAQGSAKRLSALAATLLKHAGGRVELSKVELEQFKGMAINIKWELPEGITDAEKAEAYVFSYEAITEAELAKMQAQPAPPAAPAPGAPPDGPTGPSTFTADENPADVVPQGTAFPDVTGPAGPDPTGQSEVTEESAPPADAVA